MEWRAGITVRDIMKIYLVGGAVRDRLLGIPYHEKDWVVVGSTPEEMLKRGFRPVGKDFPVFLHPVTHEEYALARTERKTGPGYTQFVFHTSPTISLEEDLYRRDLTINAIAMTESGNIIDPYHGQQDLKDRILRHVSEAFMEDPVRILRVARLLARLAPLGFNAADETYALMREMTARGEVDSLVLNRVWTEWDRALGEAEPQRFFEVLAQCGAGQKLFPEFTQDSPSFSLEKIESSQRILRFAIYMLDLNTDQIKAFAKRYPVPSAYTALALIANQIKPYFYQKNHSAELLLNILEKTDAYRRENRFYQILTLFEGSPLLPFVQKAYESTKTVSSVAYLQQEYTGKALGEVIRKKRLEIIGRL
jgi:tRNA nucleotidyltransferase (CCA-adding enzyme)